MSGICLNEDSSHFFSTRTADDMTVEGLQVLVDHYVSPQMKELIFNPNCMRTSYDSKAWQPIWKGYDPQGGPDQPFWKGTRFGDSGPSVWPANALLLQERGIDPYEIWLKYARERGVAAWLSMRMNDFHNVDNEDSFLHSDLWRTRPDLRRISYRYAGWPDRAFDYAKPEVREHHLALVDEYLEMYDMDGLELDWMRHGYHFRPGHEYEGCRILTDFMKIVRQKVNDAATRLGHEIKIGVRVPSSPHNARGLGMDAVEWAKLELVDMIVATPLYSPCDFDIPIEQWKELIGHLPVLLAGGLERHITPAPRPLVSHEGMRTTPETVRGVAASLLHRGADRVYLFNHMDREPGSDPRELQEILHHSGSIETATAKSRRHIVTFTEVVPPGVPRPHLLPTEHGGFRIHIGPKPTTGSACVIAGVGKDACQDVDQLEVRVNGELCSASEGPTPPVHPVAEKLARFSIQLDALNDGYNLVEIASPKTYNIVWVEILITP